MYKVVIYNNDTNQLETYWRRISDQMPYTLNRYLTVKEFKGKSNSTILWTTKATMQNFNKLRQRWANPIYVGYAFRRPWEGGHGQQSQHYAGTAMDIAQNLKPSVRKQLHQLAVKLGIYTYVEPYTMTPTWVHVDKRYGSPACSAGYPVLRYGSKGIYVFILQDALDFLGYNVGSLDGIFGSKTYNSVISFQKNYGISTTGVVACQTWTKLASLVVGKG